MGDEASQAYPVVEYETMKAAGRVDNMDRAKRHLDYLAQKGWPPFDAPVSKPADTSTAD